MNRPRSVLRHGYVAFRNPADGIWWKADRIASDALHVQSLGRRDFDGRPLRASIDDEASLAVLYEGVPDHDSAARGARVRRQSTREASRANARTINRRIERLELGSAVIGGSLAAALNGRGPEAVF